MSDCRYGVSPVNYPDPDPDLTKIENTRCFQYGGQMIPILPDHMIKPKMSCDLCNKKTDDFPQTLAGEKRCSSEVPREAWVNEPTTECAV